MPEEKQRLAAAMAALGVTVVATFVPFSVSRNKDEVEKNMDGRPVPGQRRYSLNWRVTVKHKGHVLLTTDYSAGIAHCPAYKRPVKELGHANSVMRHESIARECESGRADRPFGTKGAPILPDPVDVIASLLIDASAIDHASFEDWASDLGMDTDSRKAEHSYRVCLEIALKLRAALGDDGLRALRTAAEGY